MVPLARPEQDERNLERARRVAGHGPADPRAAPGAPEAPSDGLDFGGEGASQETPPASDALLDRCAARGITGRIGVEQSDELDGLPALVQEPSHLVGDVAAERMPPEAVGAVRLDPDDLFQEARCPPGHRAREGVPD